MATFPIHIDSDKENVPFQQKKKTADRAFQVLQPISHTCAAVGLKRKITIGGGVRSDHANHGNLGGGFGGTATATTAFREVGNVQNNYENVGYAPAAFRKIGPVVPVEQFQTFIIYEDQSDPQHITAQIVSVAQPAAYVVDKENWFVEEQQHHVPQNVDKSIDKFHAEYVIHNDHNYSLSPTSMFVTDVLSPMSVDRSPINDSASNTIGQSNIKRCNSEAERKPLPRNDRERFYAVPEYQESILEYFLESEKKHRPKAHYMRRQTDISHSMRAILVDWLVEVSEEYNLNTETLYLAVSYIDRFLSLMAVMRTKLQLVGTAALYIAAKYEEVFPPEVAEFVYITDETYNKNQLMRMEQMILKMLAFDLCTPTAFVFLNTYAVVADVPENIKFMAQYICEMSLIEADAYLRFYPSVISAASLALARYTLNRSIWSTRLQEVTKYRLEDLKEVLLRLSRTHQAAGQLGQGAVQTKYKSDKYERVSTLLPAKLDESIFDELLFEHNEMTAAPLIKQRRTAPHH